MGYFLSLSKEATEAWLNLSELTIVLCGLILAYGAAGEYLEEHDMLPRLMRWAKSPKVVFVWMVAISLIGEFFGDAGVYIFSGQLQSIADEEIKAANRNALNAQTFAIGAGVAAKGAVDSLMIVAPAAAKAKDEADKVSSKANSLLASAVEERKKLETLKIQLGWREITVQQDKEMANVLQSVPSSRFRIAITSPYSAEKQQYAMSMLATLTDGKWSLVGVLPNPELWGRIPIGVSIWCGGKPCEASSAVLHNALCAAGIVSVSVSTPEYGPDTILVIGDVRPPKFQDMEHLSLECKTPWQIPSQHP